MLQVTKFVVITYSLPLKQYSMCLYIENVQPVTDRATKNHSTARYTTVKLESAGYRDKALKHPERKVQGTLTTETQYLFQRVNGIWKTMGYYLEIAYKDKLSFNVRVN